MSNFTYHDNKAFLPSEPAPVAFPEGRYWGFLLEKHEPVMDGDYNRVDPSTNLFVYQKVYYPEFEVSGEKITQHPWSEFATKIYDYAAIHFIHVSGVSLTFPIKLDESYSIVYKTVNALEFAVSKKGLVTQKILFADPLSIISEFI